MPNEKTFEFGDKDEWRGGLSKLKSLADEGDASAMLLYGILAHSEAKNRQEREESDRYLKMAFEHREELSDSEKYYLSYAHLISMEDYIKDFRKEYEEEFNTSNEIDDFWEEQEL